MRKVIFILLLVMSLSGNIKAINEYMEVRNKINSEIENEQYIVINTNELK